MAEDDADIIDVSGFAPGDYIEPRSICDLFGVAEGSVEHAFKILWLKEHIERESFKAGRPLLCKGEGKGLRVMTDEEAVDYLWGRFELSLLSLSRLRERYSRITIDSLSDELKALKESRQSIISRTTQMAISTRRSLGPAVTIVPELET